MDTLESRIRTLAAELLRGGKIDIFMGYRRGALPVTAAPCFLTAPRAAAPGAPEQLVYGFHSVPNLAAYLAPAFEPDPRLKEQPEKPVLGVLVRSCDLRSVYTLIREQQVPRDKLVLVGVPCRGMVDLHRLKALPDYERITDLKEKEGGLELTLESGETRCLGEEFLQTACRECLQPSIPAESVDYLIEGPSRAPSSDAYAGVNAFEALPAAERWRIFREETEKCIRCYACRQACPTCYCRDCFAEQTDLRWIGASCDLTDTMIFHLVRVFHQTGRCSSCGACARACPMGVDLRTFTQKIVKDAAELFGAVPDFSAEGSSVLSVFREDDGEEFLSEP
jgi:formate dehydrogenase subunit beta